MVRKQIMLLLFMILWIGLFAQAPDIIPYGESEPLELTLTNIIVYIVLPVLIIIGYLYFRKKQREKEREQRNQK